jgi:hypothetical protein
MKLTLAQAIPLRSAINKRIQELQTERIHASKTSVEKGEKYEIPARNVDGITEEIRKIITDFVKLNSLVAQTNLSVVIEWDGEEMNLVEAIELSKRLRTEVDQLKQLGSQKKQERSSGRFGDSSNLITFALYDTEAYRSKALKLEREVNFLSSLIERQNHLVEIEFDASDYIAQ